MAMALKDDALENKLCHFYIFSLLDASRGR